MRLRAKFFAFQWINLFITLTTCNTADRFALLAFKNQISNDPSSGILSSWNASTHHCSWEGISCSGRAPSERVTAIDLASRGLTGSISPSVGNLTFLHTMRLDDNQLHGKIPYELGHLQRLQHLNISSNSLDGEVPANLTHCSELQNLHLANNQLTGSIPIELSSLSKLANLSLYSNSLAGVIPSSLGNLSSLTSLDLANNHLVGNIPAALGNLAKLTDLHLSMNMLSGSVPLQLFNLSQLIAFRMVENELIGTLPSDMGMRLPHLEHLSLGVNRFYGHIPASLSNASKLYAIDISRNQLSGSVPPNLGELQYLNLLNVERNQLEASDARDWLFLDSLTNCSSLQILSVDHNKLGGVFPTSVANLSTQLHKLLIGNNFIQGTIPSGVQNLVNLIALGLESNLLVGTVPESIGNLNRLQVLELAGNQFTGPIPHTFSNLTKLSSLNLSSNYLEGSISSSLGKLQQVDTLDLSNNRLNGSIPKEILSLVSLSNLLDLSNNLFDGSLPLDVGILRNIQSIDLSHNNLSGEIPEALGDCESLEKLSLGNNLFQGSIPESLGNIKELQVLDLSHNALSGIIPPPFIKLNRLQKIDLSQNKLSGKFPDFLMNLTSLYYLNLSYNNFYGEVPMKGVFTNATGVSLLGNDGLCGGSPQLKLPACLMKGHQNRTLSPLLKVVIPIACAIMLLLILTSLAFVYWRKLLRRKQVIMSPQKDQFPRISYRELFRATDGFSSSNLVGSGSHGSVYKGTLDDKGTIAAVKVFDLQRQGASKSFLAECRVLQSIRHRNLLKILTSCSSIDSEGNDFKALVFEFMPKGSLETLLHHPTRSCLTVVQRLNIAIDVASALEYLHFNCQPQVVHCDLKPSNVLLDNNMNGHLGDFGISKILSVMSKPLQDSSGTIGIRGSIGYIPPEYATGSPPSSAGDMYSYGILLLEMFTGKSPVNDMFKDGLTLRGFVGKAASLNKVLDIADPIILTHELEGITSNTEIASHVERIRKCLLSVAEIGLSCSEQLQNDRARMETVTSKLQEVKNAYVGDCILRRDTGNGTTEV